MVVSGLNIPACYPDGTTRGVLVKLIDFDNVEANDFLVANQFTMHEGEHHRRPDIVAFVNGIPLGVIELKNAATRTRLSTAPSTRSGPTRPRYPRCSCRTSCLLPRTAWRHGSAQSRATANGSWHEKRWRAEPWPRSVGRRFR